MTLRNVAFSVRQRKQTIPQRFKLRYQRPETNMIAKVWAMLRPDSFRLDAQVTRIPVQSMSALGQELPFPTPDTPNTFPALAQSLFLLNGSDSLEPERAEMSSGMPS